MKKRIMACVVACAVLLMGTGYAYWTDVINIGATASTGKLNVEFTGASYEGNNFVPTSTLTEQSAYDATSQTTSFKDNNVTFGVSNLYPGHYQVFSTTVVNTGTVAAKLGKINVRLGGWNSAARNVIGISVAAISEYTVTETTPDTTITVPDYGWKIVWKGFIPCLVWDVVGSHTEVVPGSTTTTTIDGDVALGLPTGSTFVIGDIIFVRLSALDSLNINNQINNILYLTNGSEMNFEVTIGMDPDSAGVYTTGSAQNPSSTITDDGATQHKTESVTLGLVWDQYNQQ